MSTHYKSKGNFTIESMAGETVILPVDNNVASLGELQLVNDTARFILEKMMEGKEKEQILQEILSNFAVDDEAVVRKEMDEFIEKMVKAGYFEEV